MVRCAASDGRFGDEMRPRSDINSSKYCWLKFVRRAALEGRIGDGMRRIGGIKSSKFSVKNY